MTTAVVSGVRQEDIDDEASYANRRRRDRSASLGTANVDAFEARAAIDGIGERRDRDGIRTAEGLHPPGPEAFAHASAVEVDGERRDRWRVSGRLSVAGSRFRRCDGGGACEVVPCQRPLTSRLVARKTRQPGGHDHHRRRDNRHDQDSGGGGGNRRLTRRRAAVPGPAGARGTCRGASPGAGRLLSADAARTSAASASWAWRRSRVASDRASSARWPRSRPNARLPARAAVADLIVRHACSIHAPGSSVPAPRGARAFACQTVSRSRRSARRAVRMLAPRLDVPAVDRTQSWQRLRAESQQRAHT